MSAPAYSAGYRRYALVLLMLIYTVNFVDRQIVNVLAEPIKQEFHLADWQVGLMGGLAFAVFYTFLGLPIARVAERGNRPWIIGAAIATWSACTALCGVTANFGQLLLARIGVGVGEAGCSPPAHSLISDYVPKAQRASALAFYQLGVPLGGLVGMVLGGVVASAHGWRAAFLIVGVPGLALALLAALTLREPRRDAPPQEKALRRATSISETLALLSRKRTFWLVCFASGLKGMIGYGLGMFVASFFLRNHADGLAALGAHVGLKPIGLVGVAIGLAMGLGGLLGTYGGGLVTDRLTRRSAKGYVTVPAVGSIIAVPLTAAMVLAPALEVALAMLFLQAVFAAVWPGPVYAVCQSVVPPTMRATSSAIQIFIGNITGLGLGPLLIGLLSDVLGEMFGKGSGEGIRWALFCASMIGFAAAALFWAARRYIEAEIES